MMIFEAETLFMLSQTSEYALRAMAWLALTPSELVATSTLAEKTQVPATYLAKVLQQLSAADLITGRRGVGGGYRLARDPRAITLLQVIQAVGVLQRIPSCPLGIATHGSNLCPLHRKSDEAAAAVIEIYDGVTLEDLISDPNSNTPLCETRPKIPLTVTARKGV